MGFPSARFLKTVMPARHLESRAVALQTSSPRQPPRPGFLGTTRACLPAPLVAQSQGNTPVPGGSSKAFRNPQPGLNNSLSPLNSRRGPQNLSFRGPLLPRESVVPPSLTRVALRGQKPPPSHLPRYFSRARLHGAAQEALHTLRLWWPGQGGGLLLSGPLSRAAWLAVPSSQARKK